jgi:hypothetical protein
VEAAVDEEGVHPVFEVLDWVGVELPHAAMLEHLAPKRGRPRTHPFGPEHDLVFAMPADRVRIEGTEGPDPARWRPLEIQAKPTCTHIGPALTLWRTLDDTLRDEWGLE